MYFNSIQYLFFLPLVCLLYYLFRARLRWIVLLLSSCVFYMYFIPEYILCLFFLILTDFYLAKAIAGTEDRRKRKLYLIISLISNFGLLVYFKYLGFFVQNINAIGGVHLKVHDAIMPIGLSFHTFQSVSYVMDVYRNQQKPERHLGIYSVYVLFFPQMVAGPIERFATLGNELHAVSRFSIGIVKRSLPLILIGLFYKMVIADNCGIYVNTVYSSVDGQNGLNVLLAILLFSVQIYADFFGYSLIAQGSARLFGIHLADNFNFPFFSASLVDFWRKWHISLTDWFRNYVFIPLGGNRQGKFKHYRNIIIIFALSGLWHGASWNFVIWGFLHAIGYLIAISIGQYLHKIPVAAKYLFTFILVSFIFVFFRGGGIDASIGIFRSLAHHHTDFKMSLIPLFLLPCLAFLFTLEFFVRRYDNYAHFLSTLSSPVKMALFGVMFFCLLTLAGIDNLPFIYFQF